MEERILEVEGRSPEEVIRKVMLDLGVGREELKVEVLDQGATALFGLGQARPARLRVRVQAPPVPAAVTHEASRPAPAVAAAPPAPRKEEPRVAAGPVEREEPDLPAPTVPVDLDLAGQKTEEVLGRLLSYLGVTARLIVSEKDGELRADISSDNDAILVSGDGQTLEALQLLTTVIVGREERLRTRITLDVAGVRARQAESLEERARQLAEEVKRTGQSRRFEPMSSSQRKIVHQALRDDREVETRSEGQGNNRLVAIHPRRSNGA